MLWYKILLSKKDVRSGEIHKIIKLFYDILEAYRIKQPIDSVVMLEKIEDNFHYIYFSPASLNIPALVDLINIYSGQQCIIPIRNNINYLAGDIDFARIFL